MMEFVYCTDEHYDEILDYLTRSGDSSGNDSNGGDSNGGDSNGGDSKCGDSSGGDSTKTASFVSRSGPYKRRTLDEREPIVGVGSTTNRDSRSHSRDESTSTFFIDDLIANVRTYTDEQLDSLYNFLLTDHYLKSYDGAERDRARYSTHCAPMRFCFTDRRW